MIFINFMQKGAFFLFRIKFEILSSFTRWMNNRFMIHFWAIISKRLEDMNWVESNTMYINFSFNLWISWQSHTRRWDLFMNENQCKTSLIFVLKHCLQNKLTKIEKSKLFRIEKQFHNIWLIRYPVFILCWFQLLWDSLRFQF